jgi:NAD(P)-dependent dehydrogenase (short-subunit alcohol dehydrogenase family)
MAQNLFDLSGKVALITGGNSGLGFGFAVGLAKAGADVVIWGRRDDKNQAAVDRLRQYGGRVSSRVVDVASEQAVIDGMNAAVAALGRLDCVVANAGISSVAPATTELSSKMYHELMAINLHGAFYTLREGAKQMVERGKSGDTGGSLVICGSLSIFGGVPGMGHYAAAKGALNSLARTMATELGPHQVRVNVIAPGFFATEMTTADPEVFKAIDASVSAKTPLGRSGQPEDLEGLIVYLASDASRFHTGDTLVVDGGRLASIK